MFFFALLGLFAAILQFSHADAQGNPLLNASFYDYIIVGGGTSGLTVANRLSENGKRSVLVVEYAYLDNVNNPSILTPIETRRGHIDQLYNITAAPIEGLNGQAPFVAAGSVIGGSSGVNGMFYGRGSAADYDAWEALGNPGWGWSSIFPYFKKSVTFSPPEEEDAKKWNWTWDSANVYGQNGPVKLSFPPWNFPSVGLFWEAWNQLGFTKQKEAAGGEGVGVINVPSTEDPNTKTRSYARTAHYEPYKNRTNLHILDGYQVTEIRFVSNLRAVGVNVVKRGTKGPKIAIQTRRETVIAAGAIWTPWLLQRSGIGPKALLDAAGIPVLRDVPGAGANFQDHPVASPIVNFTSDYFPNPNTIFANASFTEEAKKEYEQNRSGIFTTARGNQAAFLPLKTVNPEWAELIVAALAQDAAAYLPDSYDTNLTNGFLAQRNVTLDLFNRTDSAAFEFAFSGSAVKSAPQRPLSRGTVNIDPANPLANPIVSYRTFSNPIDIQNAIAGFRFSRRLLSQPALQPLGLVELVPGANVTSDTDIEKALTGGVMAASLAHPCGTAAMLPEEYGGVVRPDLRVWQTRRLSIVDASIIPLSPPTHLQATVYAIAEKAADLIKDRTDWNA